MWQSQTADLQQPHKPAHSALTATSGLFSMAAPCRAHYINLILIVTLWLRIHFLQRIKYHNKYTQNLKISILRINPTVLSGVYFTIRQVCTGYLYSEHESHRCIRNLVVMPWEINENCELSRATDLITCAFPGPGPKWEDVEISCPVLQLSAFSTGFVPPPKW